MAKEDWTFTSLKAYVDALRASDKLAVDAALSAAEKAVLKAEARTLADKNASNEIRGAMTDAQRNFATIAAFTELKDAYDRRLAIVEDALKAFTNKVIGASLLLAAVGTVLGLLAKFGII